MPRDDSVTHWIDELKEGGEGAAQQQLWNRYFDRLVALARKKLGDAPRRAEDEEDAVLSALQSFFDGASRGRFPLLRDRTNLWPLLAKITARKAIRQLERGHAQKRGAGQVRGESAFAEADSTDEQRGLEKVLGQEPTPQFAAEMVENCQRLLRQLDNQSLRTVARLKLEGYTNTEIAGQLGIVERTVERKLEIIRTKWSDPSDD